MGEEIGRRSTASQLINFILITASTEQTHGHLIEGREVLTAHPCAQIKHITESGAQNNSLPGELRDGAVPEGNEDTLLLIYHGPTASPRTDMRGLN